MADDTSVRVAVRIRPQNPREVIEMCHVCTNVTPNEPQVWLGKDKAFTFDHVFDMNSVQTQIYETCVAPLIEGCFEGYNATVLAYGQTGSGKTYTMGTGFDINITPEELGIIPRAVEHLFSGIEKRQKEAIEQGIPPPEFKINAQFMELYNEEIIDLLDPAHEADERARRSQIKIHEDANGGIYTVGVATRLVTSVEETIQCLKVGALSRTTASTQMNAQSSRSHAIFTLHIKQQRVVTYDGIPDENDENENGIENKEISEFETLTAKFHFVDLAGSERLKRTGATGERAKEGISINCGLLALGNVISALGDRSRKVSHVPYRDSKLTRLLQDSLGGNSRTLMIACVSPSDRDFMETLNTLKYANRAKNIKNKVTINQDKSSQTIAALRREIQMLQLELMEYKQGKRIIGEDGTEQVNDMFHENTMLQTENNNLRTRIKALQETIERLTAKNCELLAEKAAGRWITSGEGGSQPDITEMIQGYLKEIEELRAKLMESEELCSQLRKQVQRTQARLSLSPTSAVAVSMSGHYDIGPYEETNSVQSLLEEARKDVKRLKKRTRKKSREEKDDGTEEGDSKKAEEEETEEIAENGDEDFDYENESSESDLEDEDEENKENYSQDLAELTSEISIKQKLIEQLELSQKRLQMMRQHYEQKLIQLHNKIKATEMERDRVLSSFGNAENQSADKVKKVKEEFEKKLSSLQSELKKMQTAKREHAQLMKNQAQYEKQLRQLKAELMDMKKAKVRLMNKMKEESQKHREAELKRNREIAQLKKESRRRENQIRTLEADKRLKETVLKRKQEEVTALRRMARPMSDRVAGRVTGRRGITRSLPFSPKAAKQKWQTLEKNISKLVLNKQSINTMERDMERWLHEREKVGHYLKKVKAKKERAIQENKDESVIRDLDNEIEDLTAYIEFIHESISECQTSIMQMEETKEDVDPADITSLVSTLHEAELKYLLEKLVNMAINQSLQAAQKEASLRETEVKMKQIMDSNALQQQLLEHMYDQTHANVGQLVVPDKETDSVTSSRSTSPVDTSSASLPPAQPVNENYGKKDKARKRTATPQELLFVSSEFKQQTSMSSLPEAFDGMLGGERSNERMDNNAMMTDRMTQSLVVPSDQELPEFSLPSMPRVPSAPGSLKEMAGKPRAGDVSPMFKRKTYDKLNKVIPDGTGSLRRKIAFSGARSPTVISRQNSLENSESTPPSSPPVNRRGRSGDNVFSRLTSGTSVSSHRKPDRGIIAPFTGKPPYGKNSPLVCTHVAEGHSQAVLCVAATDDVLFSGSKDRTVKIWDLQTGKEIQSFCHHPNNVKRVAYNEYTRLAFSVSMAYIKVWDTRENPSKCVRTLSSSGNTVHVNAPLFTSTSSRAHQLPPGESQINDIALTRYGTTLFSAAGSIVRIWDLRQTYQCVGKLSGGHQAAVMCMAVDELGIDGNLVITGSKDHYIKVFEVMERVGGLHVPKVNLEPPHYDGIESLAIANDYLFSGSRDMCIKKWDLNNQTLVQSINQAHKDWVCAITVLPGGNALLSGCRGGFLKLWATDTCQLLGEMRAHNANINAITLNSSVIFTASNDNTVALWRSRSSFDASPDSYSDFGDDKAF